ncbi:MAG: alginate export family protein, partial [Pseudohongiellaceae bacterium]
NVAYKFGASNTTEIKVGRFTQDWGSRTLVARNRFRNAINTFDGVSLTHRRANGSEFKLLSTQPVRRTPRDRLSLLDNERETDKSSSAQRYSGVFASFPRFLASALSEEAPELTLEAYYLALREKDTSTLQTANRQLDTFGFRLRSAPGPNRWDVNIESIFQSGARRGSSNPNDDIRLDHQAFYQRAELAYSFDVPSRLRAIFEFNYASGDEDPLDQESGRFDSLFGVTAFEFGPVALYAPFNRSNLITPGLRLTATPWRGISLMADYRHFWMAEEKDSWGRTGQRDSSGDTDSYLGQHLEFRLRWTALPGNIRVDAGFVFLDAENLVDTETEFVYIGTKIDF